MGCGSSVNQVSDSQYSMNSSKPLKIEQMFANSLKQLNKIYLFGETQTKRKVLELAIDEKSDQITFKKISQRYHIPRPKVQRDTVQMMYEEAQQAIASNMYNSTTLPPFNLMFVTSLSQKVFFLCGGVDFQFWNVCQEAFLYKITSGMPQDEKTLKVRLQKPESTIVTQKTTNVKQNATKRTFNKFQRLSFMNQPRYSHIGISIKHPLTGKNFVYVFGGYDSNKVALKTCEMYSFEKNSWQKLPDMQLPRATGFCFEYLQKIYVCGGFTGQGKRSKKIEVWDLSTQRWNTLNIKLHHGIQQGFITSFCPNQIIIVGGSTEGGCINSVVRYNLIDQTYKWDSDLIHADSLQKAFNYSSKVYLFGGLKPSICQIYDSKIQCWGDVNINSTEDIKIGQLNLFSSLTKSLSVDFLPSSSRKKEPEFTEEDILLFGTDFYPILYCYRAKDLFVTPRSVSMKLRLRKNMGILRYSRDEYFICGGVDSFQTKATKATFNYNFSTKVVTELSKMPDKKFKFGLIKHKNHIYAIGGSTVNEKFEEVQLRDCCRFNTLTKQWESICQLKYSRSECEVVEVQNGLLVFGGYFDGEWVQKVQFLDTTQERKNQFVVLAQQLPLLFPIYSQVVSYTKSTNHVQIYVISRNLQMNNLEQVYFTLNLHNTIMNQELNQERQKPNNNVCLDKLQQFDSIDVIITERLKNVQIENQEGSKRKNQQDSQHCQPQINESILVNNSQFVLNQQKNESKQFQKKKNLIGSGQKVSQEQIKMPTVQVIQIKSKKSGTLKTEEIEELGVKENTLNKNEIEQKFSQNAQNIEELQFQFQKIKLNLDPKQKQVKSTQNAHQKQQTVVYDDLKSQPLQQYQTIQMKKKDFSYPSQQPNKQRQNQPHFVQPTVKKVVKGLQSIQNLNEWIRIKQASLPQSRIVFIKNDQVVKCTFQVKKQAQIKVIIVKEKYDNGEFLFEQSDFKNSGTNKLTTHKLKQNYV